MPGFHVKQTREMSPQKKKKGVVMLDVPNAALSARPVGAVVNLWQANSHFIHAERVLTASVLKAGDEILQRCFRAARPLAGGPLR